MFNNPEYDRLSKELLAQIERAKKLEKQQGGKPSEQRLRLGDELMETAKKLRENLANDDLW
jgi:hypothetical protein